MKPTQQKAVRDALNANVLSEIAFTKNVTADRAQTVHEVQEQSRTVEVLKPPVFALYCLMIVPQAGWARFIGQFKQCTRQHNSCDSVVYTGNNRMQLVATSLCTVL